MTRQQSTVRRSGRPVPLPRRVEATVGTGEVVIEPDRDCRTAATVWVDGAAQSCVDLADPTNLVFEYVQHIAAILEVTLAPGRLAALHLGGAGCTLPRYLAAIRPGTRQRVAEIDGPLVELVRAELPFDPRAKITVSTIDGRTLLERARPGSLDAIVVDVFVHAHVPSHLATVEFFALTAQALRSTGVLAYNLVDGYSLTYVRDLVATARGVFTNIAVAAEPGVWRGRRFANLILVASAAPLPIQALSRRLAGGMFPARLVHGAELDLVAVHGRVSTDAAPRESPTPPPKTLDARR